MKSVAWIFAGAVLLAMPGGAWAQSPCSVTGRAGDAIWEVSLHRTDGRIVVFERAAFTGITPLTGGPRGSVVLAQLVVTRSDGNPPVVWVYHQKGRYFESPAAGYPPRIPNAPPIRSIDGPSPPLTGDIRFIRSGTTVYETPFENFRISSDQPGDGLNELRAHILGGREFSTAVTYGTSTYTTAYSLTHLFDAQQASLGAVAGLRARYDAGDCVVR